MIDPADQKASDEAIKRNTNLTPTEVRQSLNATAIDFQRRVDAAQSITPTVSTPQAPAEITSRETKFDAQPVVLPAITSGEEQNPFPPTNQPAGTGTDSNPFVMPAGTTISPETTTWHIESPPAGTDGVQLVSPIRYFVDASPDTTQVVSTPGGPVTLNSFIVWTFVRPLTFDSLGNLVAIGAEDRIDPSISPTQNNY